MASNNHNIYLTKKEKLYCQKCKRDVPKGHHYVAPDENAKGYCLKCSPFIRYTFLPSGDAAMTRRSKKHSTLCGVVLTWNHRRRRYERKGQFVEAKAITLAKEECAGDKEERKNKNIKAAAIREIKDQEYIKNFALAIRAKYPKCPVKREYEIAKHACEKHSGRVGRTAQAKGFDSEMINRAVEAHIRHKETNYDNEFGKGKSKREIRSDYKLHIQSILRKWS